MSKQTIIYSERIADDLERYVADCGKRYDRTFLLMDETTEQCCRPLLCNGSWLEQVPAIVIGATDTNKTLSTLSEVWLRLANGGASRHSLLINLGGGMVTDLGGFAASTFKRGIDFINVPTTLLAMVDAAVGGKTGINFNGLKNEIGVFNESKAVVVHTEFLRTLDAENMASGFAEMLKHALLENNEMWAEHLNFSLDFPDYTQLQQLVKQSIEVKNRVVTADPHERGLRKALNLGHTVGHALESLALEEGRPVLHGYAVAWGLVCELYLSVMLHDFPTDKMRQTVRFVRDNYGAFSFGCEHYELLYSYMLHDKKNVGGCIQLALLADVGDLRLDSSASRENFFEAFDFLREG